MEGEQAKFVVEKKRIVKSQRVVEGEWRKADLHLHTLASADWLEPETTYLQWLQKAESRGLEIIAITDHNTVEGIARLRSEIERLTWLEANDRLRVQEQRDLDEYRRLGEKILVLPGFEFTSTFGFHILAVFPPETSLRMLELLLLRLNVPEDKLVVGSTEVGATVDVLTAYRMIAEAGGLVIAAHVNSTHGVGMRGVNFGGQTKIAFTQDPFLHALEVTDLEGGSRRSTAKFFDGTKPEYPRRMHCIQGSDAHRLTFDPKDKNRMGIGDRVTEFFMRESSFEALAQVLKGDDFSLTRPFRPASAEPFDHVKAAREEGNTILQAFHETMTEKGGRLQKVLADAVAFANTKGGTIFVGVSATRKGTPPGIPTPGESVSALKRELEGRIAPPLEARVDIIETMGVPVLRAVIPDGNDKPYALDSTRIFVRQEAETSEAVRDEIVQLVLRSRVVPSAAPTTVAAFVPESASRPRSSRGGRFRGGRPSQSPTPAQADENVNELSAEDEDALPVLNIPREPGVPAIGVEVLSAEDRRGAKYFSIRDLRNGNVIHNVSPASARKLWSYAINQYVTNPVNVAQVTWAGEQGVWQVARRAKKLRYDLVKRMTDGKLRVFYGVTADGMSGSWQQFLRDEDRVE
jgi:hypothetical protein